MSAAQPPSTLVLLKRLASLRSAYGSAAAGDKLKTLRLLSARTIRASHQLRRLHALLCYLRAYPDTDDLFRAAGEMLETFGERVGALDADRREALADSGIEGSAVRLDFSYGVAEGLVRAHPEAVEIDWENYESAEDLDPLLVQSLSRAEVQTFDDGEVSTEEWVGCAKGSLDMTDLAWVWRQMEQSIPSRSVRERLYDGAAVPLVWRLEEKGASVTTNRLAVKTPFCPVEGPLRFRGDARQEIVRPLGMLRPVSRTRGELLIRFTIDALAARHREVYADCNANPSEVYEVDVGRGVVILVLGVLPERRLNLEGNYGYLLVKNGMPVGYGGVSPLFHQGNTGINVFEEYRGGETAFLFVQTLRVFHALFGTTRFICNAYQAGGGNKEAIASGAFWFYHKLMFRPITEDVRSLADREWAKIRARRSYRTGIPVLKQLGGSDIELVLKGATAGEAFAERWLGVLAAGATDLIAQEACRDRSRAMGKIVARVARDLGVTRKRSWPRAERAAFEGLAPVVGLVEDLTGWKPSEKRSLVRLMRSKGGPRERSYVFAMRDHSRLRRALAAYCRNVEEILP